MKVIITRDLQEDKISELRASVPEYNIIKITEEEKLKREVRDCHILASFPSRLGEEILQEARQLQWIQSWSAGVEDLLKGRVLKYLLANRVKLTSMSGIHAGVIAEHVMALVLGFNRNIYEYYDRQKNRIWKRSFSGRIEDKTIGIVGLGSIGRTIAGRAAAFKMRVIGTRKNPEQPVKNVDKVYGAGDLRAMLNEADFVVIAAPLTEETRNMMGTGEFKAMRGSAYLINIARGEIVEEEALIKALKNGEIAGAGLDVFKQEPLPEDSPFYELENVVITPHIAGIFSGYDELAVKIFRDNLKKYARGKEMKNVVDYNRGY